MRTIPWLALVTWAAVLCVAEPMCAQENATAPAWTLKNPDGRTVRLADFRGKVVLLNFWAAWCPPCRKEIPGLVALQARYGSLGLTVVGVSMDTEEVAASFAKSLGINYPVVFGTPLVAATYGGVAVVPTTFVIDRAGKIVASHEGFVDAQTFAGEIKPLL